MTSPRKTNSLPFGNPCRSCSLLNPFAASVVVFTVNITVDVVDESPGDGVRDWVPRKNVCVLRTAIPEADPLARADQIVVPPNTYFLILVNEMIITDHPTITGGGAATTFIDGNMSVRPNRGVLAFFEIIASINGVTILV